MGVLGNLVYFPRLLRLAFHYQTLVLMGGSLLETAFTHLFLHHLEVCSMTRRILAVAVLGAAALLVSMQDANAFGGRKNNCDAPCATPCNVTYVDKEVTAYKAEWKTKKVDIEVCETTMVDQKFKYFECVPVKSKAKVKVCEMTQVKSKAKQIVCETVCVAVQVPCDTGCGKKREGLFAKLCHKKDCADPCATTCETPCAPVMKTVMQKQVVKKEVEVDVVKCVPVWTEKEVDVVTMTRVEKEGTCKVCKPVMVKKTVEQKYCEMVAYKTTVKVAVAAPAPAPAPCPAPCATTCASSCETPCKAPRKGLFSKCCK